MKNIIRVDIKISIHAPREGGDDEDEDIDEDDEISIHAPREGGDALIRFRTLARRTFQSTPPARGATVDGYNLKPGDVYFNPRPPRGGRRYFVKIINTRPQISIHAPREGGDIGNASITGTKTKFQSTPPARGATSRLMMFCEFDRRISIHAPREGGDGTG